MLRLYCKTLAKGCPVLTSESDFYGEKAAARILQVHPDTLRRYRSQNLIRFYRSATNRICYTLEDLLAFKVARRVEETPPTKIDPAVLRRAIVQAA